MFRFSYPYFIDDEPIESATRQCVTTSDSEDPNSACVLPFKFGGVLQDECAADPSSGRFWCPTSVRLFDGEYVSTEGKWGFCSSSCPPLDKTSETNAKKQFKGGATFSEKNTAWKGKINYRVLQ